MGLANPIIYKNDITAWPGGIYPRNATLEEHPKVNQCYSPYLQTIKKRSRKIISIGIENGERHAVYCKNCVFYKFL